MLTMGSGPYALQLPVSIKAPIMSRATAEDKHNIMLRSLRSDFSKQVGAQQTPKAFGIPTHMMTPHCRSTRRWRC